MEKTKVWDIFVRFFHWTLVATIIGSFLTAEDFRSVHVICGYIVIALVLARIVWGFIGTKHARFSDFVYPPGDVIGYLKGLATRRPKHYLGHNPAGGAMAVALLITLLATTFAGLEAYGEKGRGPLAHQGISAVQAAHADDDDHERVKGRTEGRQDGVWGEIHEGVVGFLIFLIVLHLCGVITSSLVHRENLILAMFTGKKRLSMTERH